MKQIGASVSLKLPWRDRLRVLFGQPVELYWSFWTDAEEVSLDSAVVVSAQRGEWF